MLVKQITIAVLLILLVVGTILLVRPVKRSVADKHIAVLRPVTAKIKGLLMDMSPAGFLTLDVPSAKDFRIYCYNWEGLKQWEFSGTPFKTVQGWTPPDRYWNTPDFVRYHTILGKELDGKNKTFRYYLTFR